MGLTPVQCTGETPSKRGVLALFALTDISETEFVGFTSKFHCLIGSNYDEPILSYQHRNKYIFLAELAHPLSKSII